MKKYLHITKDLDRAKKFFEDQIAYFIGPVGLKELIERDVNSFNLLDVRRYEDYLEGHIPYATHIPYDTLAENLKTLDIEKSTIVYCYDLTCGLAKQAIMVLLSNNFPVLELKGGMHTWKQKGFEIIKTEV